MLTFIAFILLKVGDEIPSQYIYEFSLTDIVTLEIDNYLILKGFHNTPTLHMFHEVRKLK